MIVKKDPHAVVDMQIDWSAWLGADTIALSTWILPVAVDDLTIDRNSFTATTTTVWLSGGAHGNTHYLTNRITTIGGRINDQTLTLTVENR
jgi:hypothetical protein